jgi:hypothetical protein
LVMKASDLHGQTRPVSLSADIIEVVF